VRALAEARAAEVEAQHRQTKAGERLGRVIDHLVVHRAAAQRMRMRDHYCVEGIIASGVQDGFEPAGRAAQIIHGLDLRAEGDWLTHRMSLRFPLRTLRSSSATVAFKAFALLCSASVILASWRWTPFN